MKDNLLLEVVNSKNTQAIKRAIYETFKDYDKTKDPYYLYLVSQDNIDINTLTVPLCRAYIKFLIDQDDREFKNTSIDNGTIHKILRRMKAIYDINYLFSNKSNNNNYFDVMNFHGWYDRDYANKLKYRTKEKPINADIELMVVTSAKVGIKCGIETVRCFCIKFAPSTSHASYKSFGADINAAR